jgi:hypothetical protein
VAEVASARPPAVAVPVVVAHSAGWRKRGERCDAVGVEMRERET